MSESEWKTFLTDFNRELLAYEEIVQRLPRKLVKSRWLGFPGASEEEIVSAEARLGVQFPPSYRAFLKVSNGWHSPSLSITKLAPAGALEWFRDGHIPRGIFRQENLR